MTKLMRNKIFEVILGKLENQLPSYLQYHSPEHTKKVIEQAEFLANKEKVSPEDAQLIKLACLFHDTGFLAQIEDHEEKSCEFAAHQLPEYGYTSEEIDKICGMIRATKVPQRPLNLNEKIVADADLFYLGTSSYKAISEKLYKEIVFLKPGFNREEWHTVQVNFLNAHQFHTNYARKHLQPVKQKNLEILIAENGQQNN